MKNKYLALFLGASALFCCAFGLTACQTGGSGGENNQTQHPHEWSQSWNKNGTHHWHDCTDADCGEKNGYAAHDFTNGACVCGQEETSENPPVNPNPPEHTHMWSEDWDKNQTHHWHNCTGEDCTEKDGYAEHDFTGGDCVCGKKEPATEGLIYELNSDGTGYICAGIGTATATEIKIASEYNNLPVTEIKELAFENCTSIVKVHIPESVETVGMNAFLGCRRLIIECECLYRSDWSTYDWGCAEETTLDFNCENDNIEIIDGLRYRLDSDNTATLESQPVNLKGKIVIPSEVVYNGVTYTVDTIGRSFYDCSEITEVILPDSVRVISNASFRGCTSLESLTTPVVGYMNYNPTSLTVDYRDYLFGYIFSTVYYEGSYAARQKYPKFQNGTRRIYTETSYIPKSLKNVTVTGGTLQYGAFSGCVFESLTFTDGVRGVALEALKLSSKTGLGDSDYVDCRVKNITSVVSYISYFPKDELETLTVLDTTDYYTSNEISSRNKLSGCKTLKTLNLSGNLVKIGDSTLLGCSALTEINYGGTMEEWNKLEKGADWDKDTGEYTVHCSDGDIAKASTDGADS